MEKKIKLNTKLIDNALVTWSPKGLCEGTLVLENGSKKKTQACAIGCLSLDYAYSKEGTAFFKREKINRKEFIKGALYGTAFTSGKFAEEMRKHYGLTPATENAIMGYNDTCVATKGKMERPEYKVVPASLRKTIYGLRKKYEEWLDSQEEEWLDSQETEGDE